MNTSKSVRGDGAQKRYRGIQQGATCSLLPGEMARGSVELVACHRNPELPSWCIWVCRQKAAAGRGPRINKDMGARNLRCARDFLPSLAPGVG